MMMKMIGKALEQILLIMEMQILQARVILAIQKKTINLQNQILEITNPKI
jgi:hypothetical protein